VKSFNGYSAELEIDLTHSNIQTEITHIFNSLPVKDIVINNIPVEEVIKALYKTENEEQMVVL
jgi:hypothetical protein